MSFGEPIDFGCNAEEPLPEARIAEETDRLMRSIAKLCRE
jgi:hypothetical protein